MKEQARATIEPPAQVTPSRRGGSAVNQSELRALRALRSLQAGVPLSDLLSEALKPLVERGGLRDAAMKMHVPRMGDTRSRSNADVSQSAGFPAKAEHIVEAGTADQDILADGNEIAVLHVRALQSIRC